MKIAIINDTHCGARNSAEWMIKYQERFYNEIFWPKIDELGIKNIIHLGDYFESRKSAASIQALDSNKKVFLEPLNDRNIQFDLIVGNHDVFFKNTNNINSPDIYLSKFNNINIIKEPITKVYDGISICLIPWINSNNIELVKQEIIKTDAELCMGHFEFNGFPFQKGGSLCNSEHANDINLVKKFKLVLSGHFHTRSFKGNISYLGSQMQFTWADYNDPKYFHIFDTETQQIDSILNPITIFEKIEVGKSNSFNFSDYDGKIVQLIRDKDVDDEKFSDMVKGLENVSLDLKITEDTIDNSDVDLTITNITKTPELIKSYINEIDCSLDKEQLYTMMEGLYQKAINL